jgi:hypothetical protein
MCGIDATLSGLRYFGFVTQRSRWCVNAGLDDFIPLGCKAREVEKEE